MGNKPGALRRDPTKEIHFALLSAKKLAHLVD